MLWLLAALLVLFTATLELPAGQATNGNGDVYATSGLLATSAATIKPIGSQGTDARTDQQRDAEALSARNMPPRCPHPWIAMLRWHPDRHR